MVDFECRGTDHRLCPVHAWRGDAYDLQLVPGGVIRHGFDRDREQRFRCMPCGRTFTLAKLKVSKHSLPDGIASFHEYLKLELAWIVACWGTRLNTAARLIGVDWATARRWCDQADARWGEALCATLDWDGVLDDISTRMYGSTRMGSDGSIADKRWMRAASAAALLYEVRYRGWISATEYRDMWWLCDRSCTFDPAWDAAMKDIRLKLMVNDLTRRS